MIAQFLLTFREVLEVSLITSIILAHLFRTNHRPLTKYVWLGISTAIIVSLILGISIWFIYGSLSKPLQVLFEGLAAIFAAGVLSYMIFWLTAKGKAIREEIESRVEAYATKGSRFALGAFSFAVAFREGLETVLFLAPFMPSDFQGTIIGATLGVLASALLSYGIFMVGMRIDLRKFFYFTSILLVLLAGGLAGYGVHELMEYVRLGAVDLGWFGRYAYELNVPNDSLFHHKGFIGSILAVMFGYTVSAEWGRILVHIAYLAIILPLLIRAYRKPRPQRGRSP
ncbi:MAG: FTR1 family protein [Candidatus Bathyarchaeia archaeon]